MQPETVQTPLGLRLIGPAIAPFFTVSAYLVSTRWLSHRFTETSDYAALVASVLLGAALVTILPLRPVYRGLFVLIYVPVFAVVLFFYMLWFIPLVVHDAL